METTQQGEEAKNVPEQSPDEKNETPSSPEDGEFKITVRKLELPVRPRGVLAE